MEPPCKEAVDGEVSGGIIIDNQTGAVLYTDKLKKTDPDNVINACPFNIPKAQEKTGYMAKCTMCVDRVHNGLLPACVKTCPTGAMNFGDRDKMVKMAKKRLAEATTRFPKATLTGLDDLRVFYLLADVPKIYYTYAKMDLPPVHMDRKTALRKMGRSIREFTGNLGIYS
jgi:formate dehydrogenase iron-sulfur subunit